jgi:4-amino-4-deoxy-L-arabinose transferase-like glycosyltransferase
MNLYELQRRHLKIALLIGVAALVIRLLFVFITANPAETLGAEGLGDANFYWLLGGDIAAGLGFHESSWPPLYPHFLAVIFVTLGQKLASVWIVQASVSAASVMLLYLSAVRLLGDVKGLLAGLIYTMLPWSLFYTKHIQTEAIYIPLYVLVLALLILPKREIFDRFYYWIGLGIAIGLLTLARREGIQYAGMLVAFITLLRFGLNLRLLIKGAIISGFFFALVLSPLIVSNWQRYDQFVFSTTTGEALMDGNNPLCDARYCPDHPPEWEAQLKGLGDIERDAKGTELATNWIKQNPGAFLRLIPIKLWGTWGFEGENNPIVIVSDSVLYGLFLFGMFQLLRKYPNWQTIALISITPILLVSANVIVFHGFWRFRAIAYPGLVLLVAYGINETWLLWLIPPRFQSMLGIMPADNPEQSSV